jgi:hypothetical protein
MIVALAVIIGGCRWQANELELTTQGVDHAQHIFQPEGGLTCFQIHNEAHTNPRRQSQLGLRKAQLLPCGTQCITELSSSLYGVHHQPYFPFGKLSARTNDGASNVSRSGNFPYCHGRLGKMPKIEIG